MATDAQDSTFLHPASGSLILAGDWLLFSGNTLLLGLGTPTLSATGFVLGTAGVTLIQRHYAQETIGKSFLKGLLGGLAIGVPLPITGTVVGGFVLAASGLNQWKRRLRPKREHAQSDEPTPS